MAGEIGRIALTEIVTQLLVIQLLALTTTLDLRGTKQQLVVLRMAPIQVATPGGNDKNNKGMLLNLSHRTKVIH